MADRSYVGTLLNSLPPEVQYPVRSALWYVMDGARFGTDPKAKNFDLFRVTATTPKAANTEFSVAHGMDGTPATLIPVLDLTTVGSQLVPLTVSRAPDSRRVYLKSTSTNAVVTFFLET